MGEVNGAEDRFERVTQDRVFIGAAGCALTLAKEHARSESQFACNDRERLLRHASGAHLREIALRAVRVGAVQPVGDDYAKYGVPKELEALVGWQAARLVRERPMREGKHEQLGVDADTEPLHEGIG